jgi:hypothetical protein
MYTCTPYLPYVHLYYYICCYSTTDVTKIMVSLTLPVVKMYVYECMFTNELSIILYKYIFGKIHKLLFWGRKLKNFKMHCKIKK